MVSFNQDVSISKFRNSTCAFPTRILGEVLEIGFEVGSDVGLSQLGEIHLRGVEEGLIRRMEEHFFPSLFGEIHGLDAIHFGQNVILGRLQNALQTAQEGEGQNDAPVFGFVGNRPSAVQRGTRYRRRDS